MSDNTDQQLRLKQEIIKAEIIDKNYDKDKFLAYCINKKENGDDLSKWSLLELNTAISEFITSSTQPPSQQQQQPSQPQANTNTINVDIDKLKICRSNEEESQIYMKEINCKKLELSVLNNKDIEVVLKNPKASDSNFLQSTYITYEVLTESQQWLVRRRFSDFEWLRSILVKCFPHFFVPPLPGKKIGNRRFEQDFIEKRMMFLQKFINAVMLNENFKTSEALVAFLSMIDRGQFESKMRELTSYQPSPYAEDLKTLTGKLTVVDDEENEKYYTNINNYFKLQGQLLDRLNYNLKNFYLNINAACTNLEEVQKDFETLALLNTRVLMKDEVTKTFDELGKFFQSWKGITYTQNELIKSHIKDFFKYVKMEGSAYDELVQSREVIKVKYKAEYDRLNAKKEKLWQTMDLSKWEIVDEFNKVDRVLLLKDKTYAMQKMCTRETQSLENIHKQLGYANKMNMDELKKMIAMNSEKFVDNMKSFAEAFYPTLNEGISIWSSLTSYV